MHNRFEEVLKSVTISPDTAEGVKERLKLHYQKMLQATEEATREARAQISDISAKLEKVEERFALGEIDRTVYDKFATRLPAAKLQNEAEIEKVAKKLSNPKKTLDFAVNLACNLLITWQSSDYVQRSAFHPPEAE